MKEYKGDKKHINKSSQEVYDYLSDFRNFEQFLPEQISEWEAGNDYCSFNITGLGNIKLVYKERTPCSKIIVQPNMESNFPVSFFLNINISEDTETSCYVQFIIEAEVNSMMGMMVDKPLKQFVEVISDRLASLF